jgi:hypothetical protein
MHPNKPEKLIQHGKSRTQISKHFIRIYFTHLRIWDAFKNGTLEEYIE